MPRSLAAALSPLLSGWLLSLSVFGWLLVTGGVLKGLYDVLFLLMFKTVRPPEEAERQEQASGDGRRPGEQAFLPHGGDPPRDEDLVIVRRRSCADS